MIHAGWSARFPWLIQGTTLARELDAEATPFDLRLFGPASSSEVLKRWERVRSWTSAPRAVHARQLHGTNLVVHETGPPGIQVHPGADGHITRHPGVLLTVALADCVPLFAVEGARRVLALAHCGWRGVAAGIVEALLSSLGERLAVDPEDLHLHLGPAICGGCYEVGPEVFRELGEEVGERPGLLDLRGVIRRRLVRGGAERDRITVSSHCTLCGELPFFSHRGGAKGRQVAFLAAVR